MYNPYVPMYQQRLQQLENQQMSQMSQMSQYQQMPQTFQSYNSLTQPTQCYFVNSKDEMQKIQAIPGTVYIGINKQSKEIYTRSWNNDGMIDFDTYSLSKGEQETSELKTILDKLNNIEVKIKEMSHEHYDTNVNATNNAESPNVTIIQSNDARKNKRTTDANIA